jgi:hypothetical protein
MSTINKPLILEDDGIWGQLGNGALINAGGTTNPTFTVGGRGLLFDDGQSTSGTAGAITLQTVYDNTPELGGTVSIKLVAGKDFTIIDDTDNSIFFKVDAETGRVTITGDLEVHGNSSVIDTVIQDSDHWLISPKLGTTTALKIEPDLGVTPSVDLVSIRKTFGTAPVFRVDSLGNLIASQNLTVAGLINTVNVLQLKNDFNSHLAGNVGYRHLANKVDIQTIATLPNANNVQEALEQLNIKIDTGGGPAGSVRGFEFTQATISSVWNIAHNLASSRAQITIYDADWEVVIPNTIKIMDSNNIQVTFATSIAGKAMIFVF